VKRGKKICKVEIYIGMSHIHDELCHIHGKSGHLNVKRERVENKTERKKIIGHARDIHTI